MVLSHCCIVRTGVFRSWTRAFDLQTRRFRHLPRDSFRSNEDEPRYLKQPSPIVDYAWYPSASVNNPATFCFLASVRECPVKLLDGSDGRVSHLH